MIRVSLLCLAVWTAVFALQQPAFKSGARTVAVYAMVTDGSGRLVPDLTAADFEIRDNGKPQPITVFSNEIQPITVVAMLDRSGSMRGNGSLVADGAEAFIRHLHPADKARIGIFGERIEIRPEGFTNDRDLLLQALEADMRVTGPTPLWNAIDDAVVALDGQDGRRVVLVFSDGGDSPGGGFTLKNRSIGDVMHRAQRDNVMVYAIGLQTTVVLGRSGRGIGGMTGSMTSVRPDPSLSMLAEDTGGGYFELTRGERLAPTFERVVEELHHQYALGFEPSVLDGKRHKLELKVKKGGMKVRARKEYLAATP